MKKFLSVVLSAIFILSSIIAFADSSPKSIKVAVNAEFPPFEYYEGEKLSGFDIDLMNAIGEMTKRDIEYVNMPFDKIFDAVISGEVDCGISTFTATEEREKTVDFTRCYLISEDYGGYAVIFPENAAEKSKLLYAAGEESVYADVDSSIKQLTDDSTIDKLIEKYGLNSPYENGEENATRYYSLKTMPGNIGVVPDAIPSDETSFTHTSYSDWAAGDIQKARDLEIISGDYNFQDPICREDFCEIVYSYIKNVLGKDIKPKENINVVDTSSYAVSCLVGQEIIKGKAVEELSPTPSVGENPTASTFNITFAPKDFLTREEAAAILVRLVNKTIDIPVTELYFLFDDEEKISDWAMNSVQVICNMGVMKGVGENRFAPNDYYTAEQSIVTIVRIYALQGAYKNISGNGSMAAYKNDFNYKLSSLMPDDKNYMISPLSLKMAFAMAANGAEGDTKKQLLDAFNIENLDEFNKNAKELMSTYNSAEILKLNIANSLWINEDHMQKKFTKEFQETAKEYYNAEVGIVNDETSMPAINSWANEQTFGKIPAVLYEPEFETILANALYFKGAWVNDFSKSTTKKDIFTSRDGTKSEIDFMHQTDYFHYYDHGGKAVIALPYKNSEAKTDADGNFLGMEESMADISMYLIEGEYDMHTDILKGFARNKDKAKTYISLKMPKFEFEYETRLNDIVKGLGVSDAFIHGKAQFNPMIENGNNEYFITDSMQKTYIKLDEEGTEAAAVTMVFVGATGMMEYPEPIEVSFDKPFTFVIYDNLNNEVLFMGEYAFNK